LIRNARTIFVVSGQLIERPSPAILLGFEGRLEHCERLNLSPPRIIFNGSGQKRNLIESSFIGKKSSYFDIRVDSRFQFPVSLQHQLAAEENSSIALLGLPMIDLGLRA